jgi:hypothetical protein
MPGTPLPVGRNGQTPPWWNAVIQSLQALQVQMNNLTSGQQQTVTTDAYGNGILVMGQLAQTLTIGAAQGQAGVQVQTGLPASGQPNAGLAVQQGLVTTRVTLTRGNAAATVASGTGLAVGMVIGAANITDPTSGTATPAITPGTTISAISGTSVTLSQPAAESGTSIYCAACWFRSVQSFTYP